MLSLCFALGLIFASPAVKADYVASSASLSVSVVKHALGFFFEGEPRFYDARLQAISQINDFRGTLNLESFTVPLRTEAGEVVATVDMEELRSHVYLITGNDIPDLVGKMRELANMLASTTGLSPDNISHGIGGHKVTVFDLLAVQMAKHAKEQVEGFSEGGARGIFQLAYLLEESSEEEFASHLRKFGNSLVKSEDPQSRSIPQHWEEVAAKVSAAAMSLGAAEPPGVVAQKINEATRILASVKAMEVPYKEEFLSPLERSLAELTSRRQDGANGGDGCPIFPKDI